MKHTAFKTTVIVLLAASIIISCKKKSNPVPDAPASITGTTTGGTTSGTPVVTGKFMWQENGGPVISTDSAYWNTSSTATGMRAEKLGFNNYFELNWAGATNVSVGAKTMNAANFDFTFLKGTASYSITTNQTVNITATSSTTISGNFNVIVAGTGTITAITATFTGIPKQ
jgi:hypothetical protein